MAIYRIKRFSFFQKNIFEKLEQIRDKTWDMLSQYHKTEDDPSLQVYNNGWSKDEPLWVVEIGYWGPCWNSLDEGKSWKRVGGFWKKSELKTLTLDEFKVDLINQVDSISINTKNNDVKRYYKCIKQLLKDGNL